MRPIKGKRAAIELSMTTIIVVVLSLTLLILGFVFIRSIMCSAIGFTEDIGGKVDQEIERIFETSEGEIACVGAGDTVAMVPGQNFVFCSINSKVGGDYRVVVEDVSSFDIDNTHNVRNWVVQDSWFEADYQPGDSIARKVLTLNIPENAPEGNFRIKIKPTRDGQTISGSRDLDFRVTRTGVVRNVLC